MRVALALLMLLLSVKAEFLSAPNTVSPETWIGDSLSIIGNLTLKQITLPGTHDSGAFYLTNNLMIGASGPPIEALIELAEKLNIPVEDVITSWALAQDRTFYQQMMGGIRYFDLRSGWDNSTQTWRTFHLEMGLPVQSLLNDIRAFLINYPSEIVVVEVSHFNGNPTYQEITWLADIIMLELGDFLYPSDNGAFALTLNEMVTTNRRAVVTMEEIAGDYPAIFPGDVIFNTYADSDQLANMTQFNYDTVQDYMNSTYPDQLFKLSWTLTPAEECILQSVLIGFPHSLIELADTANPQLPAFWTQIHAQGWNFGNILIIDHFEESSILQVILEANGIVPVLTAV